MIGTSRYEDERLHALRCGDVVGHDRNSESRERLGLVLQWGFPFQCQSRDVLGRDFAFFRGPARTLRIVPEGQPVSRKDKGRELQGESAQQRNTETIHWHGPSL